MLNNIISRLNQRIAVGNIFDKIYGLSELVESDSGKKWATYIGNGQLQHVTGFDSQQGTLFWGKRGRFNINRVDSFRTAGCQVAYDTRMLLTAYAVVRKSHLPCESSDASDWIASRIYKLISGFDPQFKTGLKVVAYEVIPSGYTSDIRSLPDNFEFAKVAVDIDISVITQSADACYDICETGDIPLPDFEQCTPCLTEVAVDGETITGNGTPSNPLVAIGGGSSASNSIGQLTGDITAGPATSPSQSLTSTLKPNLRVGSVGVTVDGVTSVIQVGQVGYVEMPYSGSITNWSITGNASGSIVFDIWKASGIIPTVANTIIGGGTKPFLSSQQINLNTPTGWTTVNFLAGDILGFYVDSASTLKRATLTLRTNKT